MFAAGKTAAVSGAVPDDKFNYVTMLLHGDGTNGAQNNTFLDSSTNNFSITRNGNTTQGSFSPYGSNWSNNVTSSHLQTPTSIAFAFGTGDFTLECWVFATAYPDDTYPIEIWNNTNDFLMTINSGKLQILTNTSGSYVYTDSGLSVAKNTWTHLAITRQSGTCKMFVNGVLSGTTLANTYDFTGSSYFAYINGQGTKLAGYVSNARVVKGTAVYTASFTPSTTPLTAISGTSLLTCQSNRFVDNSTNNFTFTVSGSPSVQRFNPFGTSTAYSTSVIGGSAYFDGTGDYLATPSNAAFNLSSGDWTIELWVYLTADYDTYYGGHLIGSEDGNTSSGGWGMVLRSGSITLVGNSNTQGIYATDFKLNTWNHIALVRSGTGANSVSLYFNGLPYTATGNGAGNPTFTSTNGPVYVAEHPSYPVTAVKGYISNARVVKGTAVYAINQSSITVPTAPFTAITNTSVLLSGTNAGIFDNAMMNDLETVGNAQISTSVKKYGTGSLAFDGTGDYLVGNGGQGLGGNFTIEAWVYAIGFTGEARVIVDTRDAWFSTTGLNFYFNESGNLVMYVNGGDRITSSTAYSTATWYHVALARSGSTITMYVNGTSVGTYTYSTALTDKTVIVGTATDARNTGTAWKFYGYIDDLRITKGYARYTSTFTPPTAAFSDTGPY